MNALLAHCGATLGAIGGELRPGIVHRLDKETSGLLVVAKNERTLAALAARFKAHDLDRRYLAIALGALPAEGLTVHTLYGRDPVHRKRFSSRVARGKPAVTHVRLRESLPGATLVECRLETGRTHQIRVHLRDSGFPLLGDPVYGRRPADPIVRAIGETLGRQALHAALLAFPHPTTGVPLHFETPPPADFAAALAALRSLRR